MNFFAQTSSFWPRLRPRMNRPFGLKYAYATWTIVILNLLWFVVVEQVRGLSESGLVNSGALTPGAHWYQYISAMFVHVSVMHIALNMFSLVSLYVVEFLLGWASFVSLYLISGVFGNLLFNVLTPGVSAGASGAIFGVFGAALALSLLHILPKPVRNQLLVVLVLNLLYDFTQPDIGTSAHIGGLIAGMILGAVFFRRGRGRTWVLILAVLCIFVSGWAMFQAFFQ